MKLTTVQQADEHVRFAKDAWASQIGKTVPLTWNGVQIGEAKLITAKVSEGGRSVEITYEIPDDAP